MSSKEQYRFCSVCRRNHDEGRKHVFTKTHKSRLAYILGKFSKKVRPARRLLQKPSVLEGELEPEACVWCYCCGVDVEKHTTDRLTTIEWGGLLEHLASTGHHKQARHWWWVTGAEASRLPSFLLFPAEFQRFKRLTAEALQSLEDRKQQRLEKLASALREKDESQSLTAKEPPPLPPPATPTFYTVTSQHGVVQNPTGWNEGQRVWGGGIIKYKSSSDQLLPWPVDTFGISSYSPVATGDGQGSSSSRGPVARVTVAASGANLTSIGMQVLNEGEGNVHSGATPPWMRDDSGVNESAEASIGPSLDNFLKHRAKEARKGRNPKRVGADFHQRLALRQQTGSGGDRDEEWLPSFGRVWNAGSRSDSRREFHREAQAAVAPSAMPPPPHPAHNPLLMSDGSTGPPVHRARPNVVARQHPAVVEHPDLPHIRPYVRKRRAKAFGDTGSDEVAHQTTLP